jgi:phosphatidylglycerol:prolipoprotein diacylglycerol transferase
VKEGIPKERIQDLAIWIFIAGIIGARITYMIQNRVPFWPAWNFVKLWDGGLVFYGSALGGAVGYLAYYLFFLRKHGVSSWKVADLIAPCAALGLAVGRVGCLLNGCCYGNVALEEWPRSITFPLSAPPRAQMVARGYQTVAGFTLVARTPVPIVERVEPGSPADLAGLRARDTIKKMNGETVYSVANLDEWFKIEDWKRGKNDVVLTVHREDGPEQQIAFSPRTIGLHPTQPYETISAFLLFWLLLAYYPWRRRDGELMVLFMIGYAVHRFLNEMLRTDTDPVFGTGLTLSQNGSILLLLGGIILGWIVWRRPPQYHLPYQSPHASGPYVGADHHFQTTTNPKPMPK